MTFMLDKVSEDTFYENILLGLTKQLEKHPRFKNICLTRRGACTPTEISSWEQFNGVRLPEELKLFYLASNGFKLTWNYFFSIQEILPVGSFYINPISDVTLSELKIIHPPYVKGTKTEKFLKLTSDMKAFQLSTIEEPAFVALIYNSARSIPNIFVVDQFLHGYFLTNSFRKYLRMALVHMGLPFWQYCFTYQGIPPWVEQMFNTVVPHLPTTMPVPLETETKYDNTKGQKLHTNKVDETIFNCKVRETKKNIETYTQRKRHH